MQEESMQEESRKACPAVTSLMVHCCNRSTTKQFCGHLIRPTITFDFSDGAEQNRAFLERSFDADLQFRCKGGWGQSLHDKN
jgi:hypothetical protein